MKSKVIYNKVQTLRADDLWQAWLDDLAAQAGRKPSTFLRDVIYCLKFTDQGKQVIDTINKRELSYTDFAKLVSHKPEAECPQERKNNHFTGLALNIKDNYG